MSLYTPPSLIRKLIFEAEDLTLNPNSNAQKTEQFTDTATPTDVMADMSVQNQQTSPQAVPGLQGSALTMPNITQPATTVSKTVINRDIILSQLAELKSVITNYEKKFDGDDLTPEDANVYISSLLSTLVFHAERFNTFMETEGAKAPDTTQTEPAEPILPASEAAPAALNEPLPEPASPAPIENTEASLENTEPTQQV